MSDVPSRIAILADGPVRHRCAAFANPHPVIDIPEAPAIDFNTPWVTDRDGCHLYPDVGISRITYQDSTVRNELSVFGHSVEVSIYSCAKDQRARLANACIFLVAHDDADLLEMAIRALPKDCQLWGFDGPIDTDKL